MNETNKATHRPVSPSKRSLRVKSKVKAGGGPWGGIALNHGLRVKSKVKAGYGLMMNHGLRVS